MGAHWYDTEGNLVETFTNKKGGESKVTLRQARTMGLLPSVTTIIQATIPSFGLQIYRENQILEAAATTPRLPEDDDASWTKRVKEAAAEHADAAAAAGTELHDQIRHWISTWAPGGGDGPVERDPVLVPVFDWLEENLNLSDAITEKVWVAATKQYAGTVDLVAPTKDGSGVMMVDFKSQYDKLRVWDDFAIQLAGYSYMLTGGQPGVIWSSRFGPHGSERHPPLRRVSLVFARDIEGGKILTKEYEPTEMDRADRIWYRCLLNWRDMNRYWPGEEVPLAAEVADDPFVRSLGPGA